MADTLHSESVPEPLQGIFLRSAPLRLSPCKLSAREAQILSLAILGLTDDQISRDLDISSSTVNSYWVRIRGKVGPYSRTQIVAGVLTFEHQREVQRLEAEIELLRGGRYRTQLVTPTEK